MLTYSTLQDRSREFLAATGLTHDEFARVLPAFAAAYAVLYPPDKTWEGRRCFHGDRVCHTETQSQAVSFHYLNGYEMKVNIMIEPSLVGWPVEEIVEILQSDYQQLDKLLHTGLTGKLITWDLYDGRVEIPDASLVGLPKILRAFKFFPILSDLLSALWLLGQAKKRTCILVNGGPRFGILTCVLNSFLPIRKRTILLFDAFMPDNRSWGKQFSKPLSRLRKWVARRMILGASVTAVWSRRQIDVQAKFLNVPTNKFVFIPYKANHSKFPPITLQCGSYVFSGGNSRRDYRTLFEAVRGTGIPVIVSATDPNVYGHLNIPENVILIAAREPAFSRLMAASRFVVMPLLPNLVRGAGEGSVCDAMWHGRPVICADDISAFEYIEEGVTGFVVPPGDAAWLRERLIELWNHPEKTTEMGHAAYQAVTTCYTHEHFVRRLSALGAILAPTK